MPIKIQIKLAKCHYVSIDYLHGLTALKMIGYIDKFDHKTQKSVAIFENRNGAPCQPPDAAAGAACRPDDAGADVDVAVSDGEKYVVGLFGGRTASGIGCEWA